MKSKSSAEEEDNFRRYSLVKIGGRKMKKIGKEYIENPKDTTVRFLENLTVI